MAAILLNRGYHFVLSDSGAIVETRALCRNRRARQAGIAMLYYIIQRGLRQVYYIGSRSTQELYEIFPHARSALLIVPSPHSLAVP